jgi:aldehyde dehydrogenase (NAD+)
MNAVLNLAPTDHVRPLFERLRERSPAWGQTSAEQRIAKIRRLMKVLLKYREAIYETGRLERGLTPTDMEGELVMLKFEADFIEENLRDWMKPKLAPASLMTLGKKCYMRYEPKGMVLVLPSWNAPYVIGLLPTLGSLAAGDTVMYKPSELAPHSSQLIAKILLEAFPDGEVSVIEGGADAAQALLACPFDHIFYIGNNTVGRIVMRAAAEHFASITLEMGGKNPSIIGASADIQDAAMKTAWGRMCNAGQACIAPDYLLVDERIAARFIDELVKEITLQYNPRGSGFENNPEFPRIINARHFERIRNLLDDARAKGARFACGGQSRAEDRYIAPTVVTQVNDDMKLMNEEIFGPVIAVVPYKRIEDATRYIRARPKPLAAYIFSRDREEIDYAIANTSSGSLVVNHNVIQAGTNPHLSFGGVNASGMGRITGFASFAEASNARAIIEDGAPTGDPRAMFPPLSDKYKKQVSMLLGKDGPVLPTAALGPINRVVKLVKGGHVKGGPV